MNRNQGRSLIRMEGAIGRIITPGRPKADSLSHYSHDQAPPISRGYFTYSLSGQDHNNNNSPWDSTKAFLRNSGPSPVVRPSPTETIPSIYRHGNMSFPVDGGGCPFGAQELAAKQRLTYYASSPRRHSPSIAGVVSPVAAPKGHIAGSGISTIDAENCVGLAIPKPVYRHSPCCAERGCSSYGVEPGSHKLSPRVYEDEWAAHFSHLTYMHKKGQEALAQQRALQLERGAEGISLKDGNTEGYHSIRTNGPGRPVPVEPSHTGYNYNTPHAFIGSTSSKYCQRSPAPLQVNRGFPAPYDPRALTHHGVPSKVSQGQPHVPKYTHIPPYSYYPPKVIPEEHRQHHMPPFHPSRPDFNNASTSCSVVPSHHPLITRFPYHHPYNMRLNSSQPPLHHERPCARLPLTQTERPLDFSARRVQAPLSPRELCRQSQTFGAFHPTTAHHRHRGNSVAERSTFEHTEGAVTSFPVGRCKEFPKSHEELFNKDHGVLVSDSPNRDSPPKRQRNESESGGEIGLAGKKQKTEFNHEQSEEPPSPPMPVINKVFSLAPYRVYLEATGMLFPKENSKKPQPEVSQLKQQAAIQNSDLEANSGENDLSSETEASPANSNGPLEMYKTKQIKQEKRDQDETCYQSELTACATEEMNHQAHNPLVKDEQEKLDSSLSDSVPCNTVIKSNLEEDNNPPLVERSETLEPSDACETKHAVQNNIEPVTVNVPPLVLPVPHSLIKFSLNSIPPHCLKLSNYRIILPDVLKTSVTQTAEVPELPVEAKPISSSSKQARHQFMELHHSLCGLIQDFVSHTPCQELQDWLCKLDLQEPVSHPSKAQKVSCLLGTNIREVWLKGEEMVMALQKVLGQLQKYVARRECPFPHVMRAGAAFIPMLVVKEVLFSQVQGTFIDQVLQEHRVELRPTTLSEERQLTQLHRKAFSSKLRRLLSLKHLPNIYPDVLNLLYYTSVCKFLGAKANVTFRRESTDSSDESVRRVNGPEKFLLKPLISPTIETTCVEKLQHSYCLKENKKRGRVKILEETSSSQVEKFTGEPERRSIINTFEISPVACNGGDATVEVELEGGSPEEPDIAAWQQPLTSDDFSDSSDEEAESTLESYQNHRSSSGESQGFSKTSSSMVLKLRKTIFKEGHGDRVIHYQKVTDTMAAQRGFSSHQRFRKANRNQKKTQKSSRHHKDGEFPSQLHSLYSQNCSFLSTKQWSKRRWVLRSSARLATENGYPDLVGKRIHHLYEEKDKTEVWYRGVVLRIHEPHVNPLKTVFEVKYDSEPEWRYYLDLLLDYKKGWLKLED